MRAEGEGDELGLGIVFLGWVQKFRFGSKLSRIIGEFLEFGRNISWIHMVFSSVGRREKVRAECEGE